MTAHEPAHDGTAPGTGPAAADTGVPVTGATADDQPRYEPPPSVGKLFFWVLLFVLAAVVVVVGGVYFT
ncbi:hypothetical protein ACFWFU_08370 [Streptomyces sp. NPDC060235]|uniref:hypothetical protein n=1 Tax=unclassified Streptomyces TaxID=2593676 RepID=UPI00331DD3A8